MTTYMVRRTEPPYLPGLRVEERIGFLGSLGLYFFGLDSGEWKKWSVVNYRMSLDEVINEFGIPRRRLERLKTGRSLKFNR